MRKTTAGADSQMFKNQYLWQDSETEASVRLGSMYLKALPEDKARLGSITSKDDGPLFLGKQSPKSVATSINFDTQLQVFEGNK